MKGHTQRSSVFQLAPLMSVLWSIERRVGISYSHILVLDRINCHGKVLDGQKTILRHELNKLLTGFGVSNPNISKILNRLEDEKLITRVRPRLGLARRKQIQGNQYPRLSVQLTPTGEKILKTAEKTLAEL